MSKRQARQRFREWAEVPQHGRVAYDEIEIKADSAEQVKAYMEEQCRQAFAGEAVNWSVEIVDGQVQIFFHERK